MKKVTPIVILVVLSLVLLCLFFGFGLLSLKHGITLLPLIGVKLDDYKIYGVIDATSREGDLVFNGVSLKFSDAQKLKENTQVEYIGEADVAQDIIRAAKIGGNILTRYYSGWTQTGIIVVEENQRANSWVVGGQKISRSDQNPIGSVVFSQDTGEVFYIGMGIPVN